MIIKPEVHTEVYNSLRQRHLGPTGLLISREGREKDSKIDTHESYEFGGPWGVTAIMTGFPIMMYYLWICLIFYDGKLVYPRSVHEFEPFLWKMWEHIRKDASPNLYAWKVYSGHLAFQLFLAQAVTGYQQEGLPVPSLGYKTLMYNCNGNITFYITLVTSFVLHYTGIFRLTELVSNYGHLMSVAMIWGFVVPFGMYFWAVLTGNAMRMSGNLVYDIFMGACMNPRIGRVDLKMSFGARVSWLTLFYFSVSGACQHYEKYGYVSPNMAFMVLATGLYINACAKGEECIPQGWEIFHEKWGFMAIFWHIAGVPFTYAYSVVYMASHDQSMYQWSTPAYVFIYSLLLSSYYVWDTSMAQKSHFKMQTQGITTFRKTFPQLPGCVVENPTFIQTAHGNRLLTSGWWAYSRKPNYATDWIMSLTYGAIIGTCSIIPYFYSFFFTVVLVHRCSRDFERCSKKYGEDWKRYCEAVPWKIIPYVY